jgi:putative DNA primase/helicase
MRSLLDNKLSPCAANFLTEKAVELMVEIEEGCLGGDPYDRRSMWEHAFDYAANGIPVFPVHYPNKEGICSCGQRDCANIGKHPACHGGYKAATTDLAKVRTLFRHNFNISFPTGSETGLLVVDVDFAHDGINSLAKLFIDFHSFPKTRTCKTGSGGYHFHFRIPDHIDEIKSAPLGARYPGIEIKASRGSIIVPPSLHRSQRRYYWINESIPVAEAPSWLIRLAIEKYNYSGRKFSQELDKTGKIPEHQRNITLTRMAGKLRRAGLSKEQIFKKLKQFNELHGNPPLEVEDIRVIADWIDTKPIGPASTTSNDVFLDDSNALARDGFFAEPVSSIEPKDLKWVWQNRIPQSKITIIAGDPKLGKSLLALDIASRVSTGSAFPDEALPQQGDVLIISAEDDPSDTIRPRLEAVGANLDRVFVHTSVRRGGRTGFFSLSADLELLEEYLAKTSSLKLLIIDPISAYLGEIDSHVNASVRALLAPLSKLAADREIAVLGIQHLRKGEGRAIYRISGSLAFAAAARSVWGVCKDPRNPDARLFALIGSNLAADVPALRFAISPGPRVEWLGAAEKVDIDDLMSGSSLRGSSALQEAIDFLKAHLAGKEMSAKKLYALAEKSGIHKHTLARAKHIQNVKSRRSTFGFGKGGEWFWSLPQDSQGSSNKEAKNIRH